MSNAAQKIASDPNISAKVSANAGTGKTWVLASRVLRLLLSGVHPSKILCLTFTKAAAAEMKGRVVDALKTWVLLPEAELASRIYDLTGERPTDKILTRARRLFTETLQSLPPPRIQTIHSFAQEILTKFPLEAGITPYFEVIDEITANDLIEDAKQRLLSSEHLAPEIAEAVNYLAANCSENKFDDLLQGIIKERMKFRFASLPQIHIPLESFDFSAPQIPLIIQALLGSKNENTQKRGRDLQLAVEQKNYAAIQDLFLTKEGEPRKKIATKDVSNIDEAISFLQQKVVNIFDTNLQRAELEYTEKVYIAGQGLLKIYDDLKAAQGFLDYDDLIFYTRKLLRDSGATQWILYKLDSSIDHILIDEAQDTTPPQWEIISAIVDEFFAGEGAAKQNRTVFVVGDEKQSIYSFQGVDPRGFAEVTKFIGQKCVLAQKEWREIPLTKSFRSVTQVLEFVDKTFAPENLRRKVTGSDKIITHEVSRIEHSGLVEIWPLAESVDQSAPENWEPPTKIYSYKNEKTLLAENIADKIYGWINSGKAKPSDITILLSKRSNLAGIIIAKLKEGGVPVSGLDRLRLADNIGIQDLLSLASFLLLPQDDLSLAEVLKSPLFNISEDQLFNFCHARKGNLSDAITDEKLKSELNLLLKMAEEKSVYELFSYIIDTQNGRKKLASRLGEAVYDPLDEFLSLAIQFEKTHTNSLQEFIHWFERGGTEIKRDMEANIEQVRIMTIHASKGLQSKIVILPDTTGLPNTQKKQFYFDDENNFYTFPANELRSNFAQSLIESATARQYEEYLRLLYVALTRAEDEIYIAGYKGEREISRHSWYALLTTPSGEHISEI